MHEIKFPAHTQARMDAAKAAKAAKTAKPAAVVPLPPLQQYKTSGLRGYVEGLDLNARQAILDSQAFATIAYGTLDNPLPLHQKVNVALLRHCMYHVSNALKSTNPTSKDNIGVDPKPCN